MPRAWPVSLVALVAVAAAYAQDLGPCAGKQCLGIDWKKPSYVDLVSLDPTKRSASGRLPIHYAAIHCSPHGVFTSLVTRGSPLDEPDPVTGMAPLEISMTVCRGGTTRTLLDYGADPNFEYTRGGGNAIHLAFDRRLADSMVERLLETGVDLDVADDDGIKPLVYLMADDDLDMIEAFLDAGADPDVADANGNTLAHYAAHFGHTSLLSKLRATGADLGKVSGNGRAPLHLSAARGLDPDVVAIYYLAGVDPNPIDSLGLAPIHYAVAMTPLESITSLLVMGASPEEIDGNGDRPLHYALRNNPDVKVTKLLLGLGADPNLPGASGRAPIMMAVANHDEGDFLEVLVDAGADPNVDDEYGRSLLHHAILENNSKMAASLIRAGADIFKPDRLGQTPYDLAELVSLEGPARGLMQGIVEDRQRRARAWAAELARLANEKLERNQQQNEARAEARAKRVAARLKVKSEHEGKYRIRQIDQRRAGLESRLKHLERSGNTRMIERIQAQIDALDTQAQDVREQMRGLELERQRRVAQARGQPFPADGEDVPQ